MSATELLILFVVSLAANILSALAGGGAGLLQLPALLILGLPFGTALATHKIASVALGVGAGLRHFQNRTLAPGLSILILLAGLPLFYPNQRHGDTHQRHQPLPAERDKLVLGHPADGLRQIWRF